MGRVKVRWPVTCNVKNSDILIDKKCFIIMSKPVLKV